METKVCTKCKEEKSIDDFYPHPTIPNGKKSRCKLCLIAESRKYIAENIDAHKEYQKEYIKKYREKNKDKLREHSRKWRESHPEYCKEWKELHSEHLKEYSKKYSEVNKVKIKEYSKKWRKENKDRIKKYNETQRKKNKIVKIPEVINSRAGSNEPLRVIYNKVTITEETINRKGKISRGHSFDFESHKESQMSVRRLKSAFLSDSFLTAGFHFTSGPFVS